MKRKHHKHKHTRQKSILMQDEDLPTNNGNFFNTSFEDEDIQDFLKSHPLPIFSSNIISNSYGSSRKSYGPSRNSHDAEDYHTSTTRHSGMPIRDMPKHDDADHSNLDPYYTSVYGKQFKIVERDRDGNPTALQDAGGKVYRNNFGKFPMDATGDDAIKAQKDLDAKIKGGIKTVEEVVGAIGSAYSAYQGVKEVINYFTPDDEDLPQQEIEQLPTEQELEQALEELPTEEEITTAFDEAVEAYASIDEITQNIWQRFTNYYPEYSGQTPFNDPKPEYDYYTEDLHGEDLEAAEEATVETEGLGEGLASAAVESAVESTSWWEAALDVVEGIGEVALELAPLGI